MRMVSPYSGRVVLVTSVRREAQRRMQGVDQALEAKLVQAKRTHARKKRSKRDGEGKTNDGRWVPSLV
jgi:hypothetical protein